MKIPIREALAVTQMIVPEVDLCIEEIGDDDTEILPVPFQQWHYYINAMHNASELLLEELGSLPDVKPVTGIETIAQDLNCLIASFSMFYMCSLNELFKASKMQEDLQQKDKEDVDATFKRFSKYRRNINRDIRKRKIGD